MHRQHLSEHYPHHGVMHSRRVAIAFAVSIACGPADTEVDTDVDEPAASDSSADADTMIPSPMSSATSGSMPSATTSMSDGDGGSDSGSASDESTGGSPPPPQGWCADGDTVLASVAATMAPRSWVELPANDSLIELEMERALLYWNDSAVWDPESRQVHWIGGPGSCCADPPTFQRITYDIASDAWSIEATPYEGSGHAYDGNAFDPATGIHYFARFSDQAVKTWDGSTWGALPDTPWPTQPAVGLTWFPELAGGDGGLVFVNGVAELAWFDGTSWTEISGAEDEPWGTYNLFGEYNPVHHIVWLGAGNGGDRVNYVLDAALQLERRPDAPVSLNNGRAIHSVDPVSGDFLVKHEQEDGPTTWWAFDPLDDSWTELHDMQNEPDFSSTSEFQVPIPECGVILVLGHYYENRHAYLYRHG